MNNNMTYYKQTKDAAWTHTPKGTVYVSTFDNYIQPEDESLRKTPMGIDLSLCDGEDLCLFVPLTTIELEAQAQQKLNIGSVVWPEVESAKEGEQLATEAVDMGVWDGERCPRCKSVDLVDVDDHWTKCQDCKFSFVGG